MVDKIKRSRYAFFIEREDGSYIAYSTLSGAVIAFTEQSYIDRLKKNNITRSYKEQFK